MKITEEQQNAINTIAQQAFIAEYANKLKNITLDEIAALIDKNEDAFREGVPFTFESGERRYRGNLVLKLTRKWVTQDLVVMSDSDSDKV